VIPRSSAQEQSSAICPGCGETVPLSRYSREWFGVNDWWHQECHVNDMRAVIAKMKSSKEEGL
jgi:hypothetical protein